MKRFALIAAAVALASCGAREPERAAEPTVADARTTHAETLRTLSLVAGTVWSWSLRADLARGRFDGEHETIDRRYAWTVSFDERVVSVTNDGPRVIVELERQVGLVVGDAPEGDEDLGITPRSEHWVWIVGGEVPVHGGIGNADYPNVHPATGVLEQETYDPLALDDATLAYALPLRLHALWQEDGEGRRLGVRERVITGTRNVAELVDSMTVPAGTFAKCHRIVRQWTIDEDEEWLCDGAGPVRRRVSGTHANFRQLRESTLVKLTRPNALLLATVATAPS